MKHRHITTLEKLYADFARHDSQAVIDACSEKMTFQISGKSKLAGKYNRTEFAQDFFARLQEFSAGSFKLEVHDILASDLHATVLATSKVTREGKTVELRTVHVWRFEGDKPLAGYEYPRDLYQYDAIWS